MKLAPTRFTTIEGTHVSVKVNSADEAKVAIKELRQKKREHQHLKKVMQRQQRTAERARQRLERAEAARRKRKGLAGGLLRLAGLFRRTKPVRDAGAIEREIARTDELLHALDACIIQIQGKLLSFG